MIVVESLFNSIENDSPAVKMKSTAFESVYWEEVLPLHPWLPVYQFQALLYLALVSFHNETLFYKNPLLDYIALPNHISHN